MLFISGFQIEQSMKLLTLDPDGSNANKAARSNARRILKFWVGHLAEVVENGHEGPATESMMGDIREINEVVVASMAADIALDGRVNREKVKRIVIVNTTDQFGGHHSYHGVVITPNTFVPPWDIVQVLVDSVTAGEGEKVDYYVVAHRYPVIEIDSGGNVVSKEWVEPGA